MKYMKTTTVLMAMILFFSCQKYDLINDEFGDSQLTIRLSTSNNNIETRAVSNESEEKSIFNAYVFIFNSAGEKVYAKLYDNLNTTQTISINDITDIIGGKNMSIAVIANINSANSIMNTLSSALDAISRKEDLIAFSSTIKGDYIERGAMFLMTGFLDNCNLIEKTNTVSIPLLRVDAKIRFNIKTVDDARNLVFEPTEWRIVSLPKKVSLIQGETKNQFSGDKKNYFTTEWKNYEPIDAALKDEGVKATFAFYSLENLLTAKKNIPTNLENNALSDTERYALRDKNIKNDDGTNAPEFEYANDVATYVEFKGNVRYDDTYVEVSADVKFMVHLGGGKDDVDNYSIERNTNYTYTITINSVNSIEVEVDENKEKRPGFEGDVVNAKERIIDFDAYNNIFNLVFFPGNIDASLTWDVRTPFSSGKQTSINKPKDYKWVLFRLGKKDGSKYNNAFSTYIGDDNIYSDDTDCTTGAFLDSYITEVNNGTDKLLNIDQLVEVLKVCKARRNSGNPNTLFDGNGCIVFTAFMKDYYYEVNPENESETVENGLWKKFVNKDKRVLNILSEYRESADGNSSKSIAEYSMRQASIQTMYNTVSTENFTAWGSQFYPNYAANTLFCKNGESTGVNNEADNGRANFYSFVGSGRDRWDKYINYANVPVGKEENKVLMQTDYDYAKYKCLMLNRDNNGNGTIDENEVQWYLASINQLTDLWIGEESYHPTSKLYTSTKWDKRKQHYVSSTVLGANDPDVLWASEGSSVGGLSGASVRDSLLYRCVRNLGIANSAPLTSAPNKIYEYVAPYAEQSRASLLSPWVDNRTVDGYIDLSRLDSKSIRGFMTEEELSDHELRDSRGYNKPYRKFEIRYATVNVNQNWEEVRQRSQPNGNDPVCPKGWRVPTQRELALMFSTMRSINTNPNPGWGSETRNFLDPWPLDHHFSRSSFSKAWTSAEADPAYSDRPGFSVSKGTGGRLHLINTPSGNARGGVRCVRDVK